MNIYARLYLAISYLGTCVLLAILKACGLIAASWSAVTCPLWLPACVFAAAIELLLVLQATFKGLAKVIDGLSRLAVAAVKLMPSKNNVKS